MITLKGETEKSIRDIAKDLSKTLGFKVNNMDCIRYLLHEFEENYEEYKKIASDKNKWIQLILTKGDLKSLEKRTDVIAEKFQLIKGIFIRFFSSLK